MPSQTHALPPAEPTPALAALAEVFGGAHASPPQRQTAASFRCVKSAGAHAVMPRARQAPELSDSDDDHGKVPRRKRAEKAGRSKPSDLDEVHNQQSKRALACATPMWWRVQAERKVAAGHAELATSAERACRQFRKDCEADVKLQMASMHKKKKASEKLLARYLEAQDECIHATDALQESLESFPRKLGELAHKTLSGVEAHEASCTKEIETQKATLLKRGVKGTQNKRRKMLAALLADIDSRAAESDSD